jgi:Ras-related protein Rab-2A
MLEKENEDDQNSNNVQKIKSFNKSMDINKSLDSSISESDLISKQNSFNTSKNKGNDDNKEIINLNIDNNYIDNQEKDYEILYDYKGDYYLSFKLIIIGDISVGKSSLLIRAIKHTFKPAYSPTLGFDMFYIYIKIKDKILKLQVWDTGGQEIYQSLISNFYRNSSLAFMVYAINDKDSFEHIDNWLKEIKHQSNPDVKIFLIGNKCDLIEGREVSYEEGEKYYKNFDLNAFYEVSAKTGEKTEEILVQAARVLIDDLDDYEYLKKNKRINNLIDDESLRTNRSDNRVKYGESNSGKCC